MIVHLWRWLSFDRVQAPRLPEEPAIVLAAHYNGLLDGFVYSVLSPGLLGVISAQWHRTALGRVLLPGISVSRKKDRKQGDADGGNLAAFKGMLGALKMGRSLLYFPEGTSRLGAERLPVQRGTELLLRMARTSLPDIPVYFAAAHYESPTTWRSRVIVELDGPHCLPESKTGLSEWVADGMLRAQEKALARTFPPRLQTVFIGRRIFAVMLMLPVMPAWLASTLAIRRYADDTNVISLWRMLGGIPAVFACWLLWLLAAWLTGCFWILPTVMAASLMGVAAWTS